MLTERCGTITATRITEELVAMDDSTRPDASQLAQFVPVVYDELRRLASQFLRGAGNQTLQPTALVHEAYLELRSWRQSEFRSRAQFLVPPRS